MVHDIQQRWTPKNSDIHHSVYTTKQNHVCPHLEVFRKLHEELFIDPQLLKRTSWIPFRMQLLQISFYVVILVKRNHDLCRNVITDRPPFQQTFMIWHY